MTRHNKGQGSRQLGVLSPALLADRLEGGGGEDLFATNRMCKERMTEVDYWGGDGCGIGVNARASCLCNGGCVDGRGGGEISTMWGCGAREPAALSTVLVVLEERRRALELQRQRVWGRTEVARSLLFGESEEIGKRSALKRMWDKRREKREEVWKRILRRSKSDIKKKYRDI